MYSFEYFTIKCLVKGIVSDGLVLLTLKNVFDSKRNNQIRHLYRTPLRLFCSAYLVLEMEQFGLNLQQIVGGANLGSLTLLNT
jgi:hypothetical protein